MNTEQLDDWPGSLVCVDSRGEIAIRLAARRGVGNVDCVGMNQKICVLDPMRIGDVDDQIRCRFNPLNELDPNDSACNRKAAAIADLLVQRTGRENDDYWNNETRSMLQGLILHIVSSPQFEGRRHPGTLRRLVVHGDVEAAEKARSLPDAPQEQCDPFGMLFCLMMENPAFDGEVAGAGRSLFEMMKKGDRQWQGVHADMRIHTDWLRDERMQSCVEASDFALSEIKGRAEGMTIVLCLPERDMTLHLRWLRVFLGLMIHELQASRSTPNSGHEVLINLGGISELEELEVVKRGRKYLEGYGVRLM